jgi:hypothetical protein
MRKITPTQCKIVHIAVAQLGLSDQIYRDILWSQHKALSCTDLNYHQASNLIDHFKTLGFRIKTVGRAKHARRNTARNVTFLPSPDQIDMINSLAAQVAWKYADGFQRWLAKYLKISRIATSAQAQRAIEGLKGMLKNQQIAVNGEQ